MSTNTKFVSADEVRAWGRANLDLVPEGARGALGENARGLLGKGLVAAFTKAHKGRKTYEPKVAQHVLIEVPGVESVDKAGRKQTRTVTIPAPEARDLLGEPTSKRGRVSKVKVAAALSAVNAAMVADQFNKDA